MCGFHPRALVRPGPNGLAAGDLRRAAGFGQEGAALLFPGPWHAETLLDLVRDAASRDAMDPDANEDLVRWTRFGPEADIAVDGVPG